MGPPEGAAKNVVVQVTQSAETAIALRREIRNGKSMNDMARLVGKAQGKAYFDEALRQTYSFADAFDTAVKSIATREESEQLKASEPQMHMGARIRPLLQRLSERLGGYGDGQIAELP